MTRATGANIRRKEYERNSIHRTQLGGTPGKQKAGSDFTPNRLRTLQSAICHLQSAVSTSHVRFRVRTFDMWDL